MVSSTNNISGGGANTVVATRLPSPPTTMNSNTVEVPSKPVIAMPKPSNIKFDAKELRQNLKEAVSLLNEQVSSKKQGLGFRLEDSIDVPVVTVRNTETGEVVRQIPNEVVIKVAQSIDGFKGLILNKRT